MPAVSDAELIALAEAIFPEVGEGLLYVGCDTRADIECPITDHLRLRLASPGVILCRCQNSSNRRDIEALAGRSQDGGGVVRVTMFLDTSYDLVVVRDGGEWLVDDEYCAGQPATSIYQDSRPC